MKKKYFKYGVFYIVIFMIIILFIINRRTEKIVLQEERVERETEVLAMGTREERLKEIERLKELLEESKLIRKEKKAGLLSQIANLNFQNNEYDVGLEYAAWALYLAQESGDDFKLAKSLIDISDVCIELGGWDTAEKLIDMALRIPIEDKKKHTEIEEYGYMKLGDLYSTREEGERAIQYIIQSMEYVDKTHPYYKRNLLLRKMIVAYAFFYEEEIDRAKQLLHEIKDDVYQSGDRKNLIIPYLDLNVKVAICEKRIDEVIKMTNELFKMCEEEESWDMLLNHMHYTLEMLYALDADDVEKDFIKEYERTLLGYYYEVMQKKNERTVKFILNGYNDRWKYLEVEDKRLKEVMRDTIWTMGIAAAVALGSIFFRKIMRQNNIDTLTKIYNRRKFDEEYKRLIKKGRNFGVIMIDVDHFKGINDTYGHDYGDYVLKTVAKVLEGKQSVMTKVFRYGGEEFSVLCTHLLQHEIVELAEELREEVEKIEWEIKSGVTISLGIAFYDKIEDVFKRADQNLYLSKKRGRNRITY